MIWHIRRRSHSVFSLNPRSRCCGQKATSLPAEILIFSRARTHRRRDARGVGISRTSIGAPASPLTQVLARPCRRNHRNEPCETAAMVTQVSTGYPNLTSNEIRRRVCYRRDDVGASLATARPPPMREQPRGFPTGHSRAVRIDQSPFPAPPPQAVTQLWRCPRTVSFPQFVPRKVGLRVGGRRGRVSPRARDHFFDGSTARKRVRGRITTSAAVLRRGSPGQNSDATPVLPTARDLGHPLQFQTFVRPSDELFSEYLGQHYSLSAIDQTSRRGIDVICARASAARRGQGETTPRIHRAAPSRAAAAPDCSRSRYTTRAIYLGRLRSQGHPKPQPYNIFARVRPG